MLKNTDVSQLTAANFAFVSGNFSDATIDIPVYFDITASVVGTGGSLHSHSSSPILPSQSL